MPVARPLLALALASVLVGCASDPDEPAARHTSPAGAAPAPLSCDAAVRNGPLPGWARTGFRPPGQTVRYVLGERHTIVGVVFGYPLVAGERQDGKGNKILWVGRTDDGEATTDLEITARLNGTSVEVTRSVSGGPGPSLIDLPEPGCWTLDLAWGAGHDRLAVPYSA